MSEKGGENKVRKRQLIYQYTQDTTFHGVRFISEESSPILRRLLWLLVILSCVGGFTAIIILRLTYWLSHPKAVNVEIIYNTTLDFPIVTICNQNFFRKTDTFRTGHYDKVEKRFRNGVAGEKDFEGDGSCVPHFKAIERVAFAKWHLPTQLRLEDQDTQNALGVRHTFVDLSLRVCQALCTMDHNDVCNSVIYDFVTRSCFISDFSSLVEGAIPHEIGDDVTTYTRRRCNGVEGIYCDFEKESKCPIQLGDTREAEWVKSTGSRGSSKTGPNRDHTTGYGYYYLLDSSKSDHYSSLFSTYIDAPEDVCVQFFYNNRAIGRPTDITVSVIGPARNDYLRWHSPGMTHFEWEEVFLNPGSGIYRFELEAYLKGHGNGDVAIDDLKIAPCSSFERDCIRDPLGVSYMGNISTSMSGHQCLPWNSQRMTQANFPDGSALKAKNYCRNPTSDIYGPWCFVYRSNSTQRATKEYCSVPYCDCTPDEFRCDNSMCIDSSFMCDGREDCTDGSDERGRGCVINVICDFGSTNICGYKQLPLRSPVGATGWIRFSGEMRNGYIDTDHTHRSKSGHYLYLDSGNPSLVSHQRVSVVSVLQPPTFPSPGYSSVLSLFSYTDKNLIFPRSFGWINIYIYFGKYEKLKIGQISATDSASWTGRKYQLPEVDRPYRIMFEAILGNNYYSDMAIDDVDLTKEPTPKPRACPPGFSSCDATLDCVPNPNICDGYENCPDSSDEYHTKCPTKVSIPCVFSDQFMCGYLDDSDPARNGWYWNTMNEKVEVRDDNVKGHAVKRFISPWQSLDFPAPQCLSFEYSTLVSEGFCALYIYQEFTDSRVHQYTLGYHGDKEQTTRRAYATLDHSPSSRVSFEVNCTSISSMSALEANLANISLEDGSCEAKFSEGKFICDFENDHNCGYLDVSMDGANWVQTSAGLAVASIYQEDIPGEKVAKLMTPIFNTTNDTCVRFEFHSVRDLEHRLTIMDEGNEKFIIPQPFDEGHLMFMHEVAGKHRYEISVEIQDYEDISLTGDDFYRIILKSVSETSLRDCELSEDCVLRCEGKCITIKQLCDEISDCLDGSDEERCPAEGGNVLPGGTLDPGGSGMPSFTGTPTTLPRQETSTHSLRPPEIRDPLSENLTTFYEETGHQIKNMLHRCTISGVHCSADDFVTEITDYGLCHTFNSATNNRSPVRSNHTGASYGLQLILNVEQYEYMHGPQTDAGVKIFLSDLEEVPFVRDLGFAVAPGEHALVGMTLTWTQSLSQPWGDCGEKFLAYSSKEANYTYSACMRECETNETLRRCDCRDAYMPGYSIDDPPVCNLSRFLDCSGVENESPKGESCNCTEPCRRRIYETQLSYASLSSLSVSQILASSDLEKLREDREEALDITYRTDPDLYRKAISDWENIAKLYDKFLETSREKAWNDKSIILQIDHSLRVLSDILREDVISVLGERLDKYLIAYGNSFEPIRRSFLGTSQDMMIDLQMLVFNFEAVMSNRTSRSTAWFKGKIIRSMDLVDIFANAVEEYLYLLNPEALEMLNSFLPNMTQHLPDVQYLPEHCGPLIESLKNQTHNISTALEELGRLIENQMLKAGFPLVGALHRSILSLRVAVLPRANKCISEYYNLLTDLREWRDDLMSGLDQVNWLNSNKATVDDLLSYTKATASLRDFNVTARSKINQFQTGAITAKKLIDGFPQAVLESARQELSSFKTSLVNKIFLPSRQRLENIQTTTMNAYTNLIRHDYNLSRYFQRHTREEQITNITLWKRPRPLEEDLKKVVMVSDAMYIENTESFSSKDAPQLIRNLVTWYTEPLDTALTDFQDDVSKQIWAIDDLIDLAIQWNQEVNSDLQFDQDFVKSNFLAVDIYFSQLKYQDVQQLKAYDAGAFFSDVGGYMGLLLGGSLISLFEIVDLFFYQICPCTRRIARMVPTSTELFHKRYSASLAENGEHVSKIDDRFANLNKDE